MGGWRSMMQLRELRGPDDLVALIDEQGLELASLRFEFIYVIVPLALMVAIPLRQAPWWLKIVAMALVFSPILLWGMAVQRLSSATLTGEGVQTDEGLVAWKDVRLAGPGPAPQRAPGRPLFARRILRLQAGGKPLVCLASAPAMPRKLRDPLGFVPFLHEAVAAKIAESRLASAGGLPTDHPGRP